MKKFAALARVSSREQEREGFSLDVQEDALKRYAQRSGGTITKMWRIAETASKKDERHTFREMIGYVTANAGELDGILFYKVDRAARNLFDYVELERLETDHGVPFISVSQPTENTPAGHMQRRVLASMAAFYTEQQSIDVREGHARRAQAGLFVCSPPYGYVAIRREGRSLVEIDPVAAPKVRRIFQLYAYESHTIDSMIGQLAKEGLTYTTACPAFLRSKVHTILHDRAYIGEIKYQGQWLPGSHEPLVDRAVWDRVQALLGQKVYRHHDLTYGRELVSCAHCGRPVTGEQITKKKTGKVYVYYRCSDYTSTGHPRDRVPEAKMDEQMLTMFRRIQQPAEVREWFLEVLRARTTQVREDSLTQRDDLERQIAGIELQKDRLLNLRLADEVDAGTFGRKSAELRDRQAQFQLQISAITRDRDEHADLAAKVFELSQRLEGKWVAADPTAKRQILEIVCLNLSLNGVSLVPEMRKPFDVLVGGLSVSLSRGDKI